MATAAGRALAAACVVTVSAPDARHELAAELVVSSAGRSTGASTAVLLPPATPHGPHRALAPASLVAPFVAPDIAQPATRRPLGQPPPPPGVLTVSAPTLAAGTTITVAPLASTADDGTCADAIEATVTGSISVTDTSGAVARLADAGWVPAWSAAAAARAPNTHAAASFVVLELDRAPLQRAVTAAAELWASIAAPPGRGAPLVAVAAPLAPLAPRLFGGLALSAAVAAPLGGSDDPPLLLVDAPAACAAGAEGGPVVCAATGALIGVLAPPLTRADGSGDRSLPLIVTAGRLAAALSAWQARSRSPPPRVTPAAAAAADAVAALYLPGHTWATAVHVGGGAFLTAAHGVAGAAAGARPLLQLRPPRRPPVWAPATVVPAERLPAACAGLDVAAVQLDGPPPRWLRTASLAPLPPPRPGAPVTVLGFPHVHPSAGIGPIASTGAVARVLAPAAGAEAELIVSTAAVVPGASGGPAVDAAGSVVGLAICAARVGGDLAPPLPHLNAVLCGAPLAAAWRAAAGGKGVERADPPPAAARAALWALADPPPAAPVREGRAALDDLVRKARL